MRSHRVDSYLRSLVFFSLLFLGACTSIIADYSLEAYKNATSLKARSMAMIDRSGEAYGKHSETVIALLADIDAAYEFSNGLPNNRIAAKQWDLIRNPNGNLVGGFATFWRTQSPQGVGDFFRAEVRTNIARAFDYVICLEVNKRDSTSCSSLTTASE